MLEENNSFDITKNSHDLLNEAYLIALRFNENPSIDVKTVKEEFPVLERFDLSKISTLFETFPDLANKTNIFLGGIIFFIISQGKYPQDLWNDALKTKDNTRLAIFKRASEDYKRSLNEYLPLNYKSDFNSIIKDFKRKEIMPFVDDKTRTPGLVCLYETAYETFVEKYDKYSPRIYIKLLEQYKDKKFHKRKHTEVIKLVKNGPEQIVEKEDYVLPELNAYAVSFAGNMDKPGHADCEDCSLIANFGNKKTGKTFLVVVCDGVGSAIDSETGSKCACEALKMVIANYIKRTKVFKKSGSNTSRKYKVLMPMLQYDLASDLYVKWAKLVRKEPSYQKVKKQRPGMDQFTSTMQFAFVTPLFVCTGKVGDGSFYLRKREKNGKNDLDGIFELTDGRSDVLEKSVLNMALLGTNPSALQINFFRREEVKDILITSDGVSPLFKEDIVRASKIMNDLYQLPYQERVAKLEKMAMHGSDVNAIDYSSGGDDASVAYVSFGNEE